MSKSIYASNKADDMIKNNGNNSSINERKNINKIVGQEINSKRKNVLLE